MYYYFISYNIEGEETPKTTNFQGPFKTETEAEKAAEKEIELFLHYDIGGGEMGNFEKHILSNPEVKKLQSYLNMSQEKLDEIYYFYDDEGSHQEYLVLEHLKELYFEKLCKKF